MRHAPLTLAAAFTAALAAAPASAAEEGERILPTEEELQELGRQAERLAREFAERMSPLMRKLEELAGDLTAYEAPEMLPNGDIIIRRKPDEKPAPPPTPEDGVAL